MIEEDTPEDELRTMLYGGFNLELKVDSVDGHMSLVVTLSFDNTIVGLDFIPLHELDWR